MTANHCRYDCEARTVVACTLIGRIIVHEAAMRHCSPSNNKTTVKPPDPTVMMHFTAELCRSTLVRF